MAGCRVSEGSVTRSAQWRVMRNGDAVFTGRFVYECWLHHSSLQAWEHGTLRIQVSATRLTLEGVLTIEGGMKSAQVLDIWHEHVPVRAETSSANKAAQRSFCYRGWRVGRRAADQSCVWLTSYNADAGTCTTPPPARLLSQAALVQCSCVATESMLSCHAAAPSCLAS